MKIFSNESSNFIRALHCCNDAGSPPIWLMRQAGRYLASYRAMRQKYSFLQMCHEPDLITEVTLLPLKTYDFDAAILFSDILIVPEAMGVGLRFEDHAGPMIERPLVSEIDVDHLPLPNDLSHFDRIAQGIRQLRQQLQVPLIGFCGAPYTIASYMIEGKTSKDFKKTKSWLLKNPESFHRLLNKISDWSIAYLKTQINAGVQAIQIFDSWANSLSYHHFREFSLAYLKRLLEGIAHTNIPTLLFCRGSSVFAPQLAELKPNGIGLDWNCQMARMRHTIPASIALQGNLDPQILYAPHQRLEEEVDRLLQEMQNDPGYIFNLGHGIAPDVSEDAVSTLVSRVKRLR